MDSTLATKPASYKQLMSRSLTLYRLSFSKIILFSFLMAIVVFIPRIVSDIKGQDLFVNLPPFSLQRLWFVLVDLVALMFLIAIIWHMYCVVRKKHEPMVEDVATGAKKALAVFVASLIQCAILFAVGVVIWGVLILMNHFQLLFVNSLGGIILTTAVFFGQFLLLLYVSASFVFLLPLIALENKSIFSAIENSVLLVVGNFWRVVSAQITPWICYLIALILIKFTLFVDINIYFTNKLHHSIGTTLINIGLFTLFIPWVAALLLTQLKDLELRKQLAPAKKRKRK